jgi:hypothetical protein
MAQKLDVFSDLDEILASADTATSPWRRPDAPDDEDTRVYEPAYQVLHDLMAVPIEAGHALTQQSGRVAKSLDAYVAYELRRAGLPEPAVFPRARQPRVLSAEFADVEEAVAVLESVLAAHEARTGERLKPAALRHAINRVSRSIPGAADAKVLGRFYTKQVDVVVADWRRGPDVLVSGKSMFSSYLNNINNRYEEAIGEAHNLRDRYPLAAMGYVYLVRDNVFKGGAFSVLRDLLIRLRKPDGPFDATVLLVASWDDATTKLHRVEDPAPALALSRFFEDLLSALMTYTPINVHEGVRLRYTGEPPLGGLPPSPDLVDTVPFVADDLE